MYQVAIVFKNGSKVTFDAQAFDLDLDRSAMGGRTERYKDQIFKFTYKDGTGEDAPIYLNPEEVAGIAVVSTLAEEQKTRSLEVL